MEVIKKYFKKIDFISQEFNFEYEDSKMYKTYQGAFFSLITFFTATVIAIAFGREVYLRETPNVNTSDEAVSDSKIFLKDFPMTFSLINNQGQPISNIFDYFDIRIDSVHMSEDNTIYVLNNYTLTNCSNIHFDNHQEILDEYLDINPLLEKYCINSSDSTLMQGEVGQINSAMVRVIFAFCDINEEGRNCKANSSFFKTFPNILFKHLHYYVNSLNYENPIMSYLKSYYISLT